MSDLIERSCVLDTIENFGILDGYSDRVELMERISKLPSIDAVPVVRCKDCKYYKENTLVCGRYGLEDDDYCSWAERKES